MVADHENDAAPPLRAPRIVVDGVSRPVKVLHIGNIANNAFYNSLLMRRIGYDSYVLQYDYYHAPSYPEWELCDFDAKDLGDLFFADWERAGVRPEERPEWHVIGPMALAVDYLDALVDGHTIRSSRLRHKILRADADRRRRYVFKQRARRSAALIVFVRRCIRFAKTLLAAVRRRDWDSIQRRFHAIARRVTHLVYHRVVGARWFAVLWSPLRRVPLFVRWRDRVTGWMLPAADASVVAAGLPAPNPALVAKFHALEERWGREFPHREPMVLNDLVEQMGRVDAVSSLVGKFDLVIGYSTDPILAFLNDTRYLAFEHGTLREIPFWQNGVGRLTSLAYRHADHVFITNEDCEAKAKELGVTRYTMIPHPFDNERDPAALGSAGARARIAELVPAQHVFLALARHDWVEGDGYNDKANDRWIRAVAQLRTEGLDVGVITPAYGHNVSQSRALIEELGISDAVAWVDVLCLRRMEDWAMASSGVLDQFELGTGIGGVAFKCMAVGATVISSIDQALMQDLYGEEIPILSCATVDEIATTMRWVVEHPEMARAHGDRARDWIDRHYGWRRTVGLVNSACTSVLVDRGVVLETAGPHADA